MSRFEKDGNETPPISDLEPRIVSTQNRIPIEIFNSASRDKVLQREVMDSLKELCFEAAGKRLADVKIAKVNWRGDEVEREEDATHYLVQSGMVIGDTDAQGDVKDPLETASQIVETWYEQINAILNAPERNELVARIADAIARAKGFDHGYEPKTDINYGQTRGKR